MNQSHMQDRLISVYGIMQQMLLEARNDNWDTLTELDQQRRSLLTMENASIPNNQQQLDVHIENSQPVDYLINTSVSKLSKEELANAIRRLDQQLLETVLQKRQTSLNRNRAQKQQINAKQIYARASFPAAGLR
ncbi:MAG: hypothetical protein KTR32_03160 [Granulosicoccus sp.]|nr:hypothetical protein [Granulosicoccus sp.]